MPELTVLTLTLNESGSLQDFFDRVVPAVSALTREYEIVVVDGGSTDDTAAIAERNGARVVVQSAPGYGVAYREGLAAAKGDWILTADADLSHPMSLLPELWSRRNDCAVVMGSRYLPGSLDERPAPRRLMSVVLNAAYSTVLGLALTDISGGFRLYRGEVVRNTPSAGMHYDVVAEIMVRIAGEGHAVFELPYHYANREKGSSKARILYFGWCYGTTLLKLFWWLRFSKKAAA